MALFVWAPLDGWTIMFGCQSGALLFGLYLGNMLFFFKFLFDDSSRPSYNVLKKTVVRKIISRMRIL